MVGGSPLTAIAPAAPLSASSHASPCAASATIGSFGSEGPCAYIAASGAGRIGVSSSVGSAGGVGFGAQAEIESHKRWRSRIGERLNGDCPNPRGSAAFPQGGTFDDPRCPPVLAKQRSDMKLKVPPVVFAAALGLLGPAALDDSEEGADRGVDGLWKRSAGSPDEARAGALGDRIEVVRIEDKVLLDDGSGRLDENAGSWTLGPASLRSCP